MFKKIFLIVLMLYGISFSQNKCENLFFIDISGSMSKRRINVNKIFKDLKSIYLKKVCIYTFDEKCLNVIEKKEISINKNAKKTLIKCIFDTIKLINPRKVYIFTDGKFHDENFSYSSNIPICFIIFGSNNSILKEKSNSKFIFIENYSKEKLKDSININTIINRCY